MAVWLEGTEGKVQGTLPRWHWGLPILKEMSQDFRAQLQSHLSLKELGVERLQVFGSRA